MKKRLAISFLIGGLALMAWLIVRIGAPAIGTALGSVGWRGLLAIAGIHLIATTLMGLAWWRLKRLGRPRTFIWGRLVRDAGSEVLPLSQIGGYVLGARAVIVTGVPGIAVAASALVDATLEFAAQVTYIALGLSLMMRLAPSPAILGVVLLLLAAAIVLAGVVLVLRRRGVDLSRRIASRLAESWIGRIVGDRAAIEAEIRGLLRLHREWPSYLLHLAAWLVSGVEAWIALHLMGVGLGLPAVLAIESLVHATRATAFMVPNAIGVQEGAYVVIGGALGLTPEFALGLSLLKRGRDAILGIPALATWQFSEGARHLARGEAVPLAADPPTGEK